MSGFACIGVAGAGAFGTALALCADRAGRKVVLWGRDAAQAAAMRETRENKAYLPGVTLPETIEVSSELADIHIADAVLLAVPAQATRATAERLADFLRDGTAVVACAKGIEQGTQLLQSGIVAAALPKARLAALSGPGFAEEIAAGLPTAVTIGAEDLALADGLCAALSTDSFRPYASDDLTGVELGGAIKNVLAIACGVAIGRGLGESARAALISRGLAEMMRIGCALGARPETFMGLAGVGDLVLTATSPQSRNTSFGMRLGEGRTVGELSGAGAPLVEGFFTARVAADLAAGLGVDAPVIAAVAAILQGSMTVETALTALMARPLRREAD